MSDARANYISGTFYAVLAAMNLVTTIAVLVRNEATPILLATFLSAPLTVIATAVAVVFYRRSAQG